MSKIKSFNKLKDFVDKLKPILYMRENHTKENPEKREILVCGGTCALLQIVSKLLKI